MFPMLSKFPALKKNRSPVSACLIGFVFGSIGLAIYFRSLIDLFAPLVFLVVFVVLHNGPAAGLIGALLTAAYGFCRALDSNDRLSTGPAPHPGVIGVK